MGRTDQYKFGINSFNNGMRCDADPDDIGGVYARLLKNVNINKIGAVTTRFGHEMFNNPDERITPSGISNITGTVSASSTGSTLVISAPLFLPDHVGRVITNTTDSVSRTITAYTNATTVTVNSAINDTWDGDSFSLSAADPATSDGWIQTICSAVTRDGTLVWEMMHQGIIYTYNFTSQVWTPLVPVYAPIYKASVFKLGVVSGSTVNGTTLIATTSIFETEHRGLYVYNLANNQRRRIVGYTSGTTVVLDRPIVAPAWTGQNIIIQAEISSVEYNNNIYYASSGYTEYLKYTSRLVDSSGIVAYYNWTDGTGYKVRGQFVTTANNSLFVAGGNLLPRHMIWTNPGVDYFHELDVFAGTNADTAGANSLTITTNSFTREAVGQYLYNITDGAVARITGFLTTNSVQTDSDTSGWDNDEIHMYSNWFQADGNITGIIGLDTAVAVFDAKNLYLVDIVNGTSQVFRGKGTLSPKSLAVSPEGDLYWVSSSGTIYRLPSGGRPKKISQFISNANQPSTQLGLVELIDPEYIPRIAGGIYNSYEYLMGVNDLSGNYFGTDIDDAVFIYNPVQDNWRLDTYSPAVFHTTIDNNNKAVTLFGSYNNRSTFIAYNRNDYLDNTGYMSGGNKVTASIQSVVELWQTTMNRPDENKQVSIYIRLACDAAIVPGNPPTGGTLVETIRDQDTDYSDAALIPETPSYVTYPLPLKIPAESLGVRVTSNDRIDISSILFECTTMDLQNARA